MSPERRSPRTPSDAHPPESKSSREGATLPGKKVLSILFLTVFLDLVGFGIVIPLLPLYAESLGASPISVTALVAVYSMMQFVFAPWWGQLSDRVGRRPVLLVGLFGSGVSYLLFGLSGTLAGLFVARILAGVMGANIGVAQAYIADVTRAEDRARGMGIIGAAFGLGFILGPLIGGVLSQFGSSVPFFGAAALAIFNGVLGLSWLPESLPRERRHSRPAFRVRDRFRLFVRLSRDGGLGTLYLAFFLITLAFAGLEATLSIWADRRWALGPAEIAYLFAYLGVVATLVQGLFVGPLARRLGERRLAILGAGFLAAGLAGTALAPSFGALAGALAMIAFGQGVAVPSISALISRRAPETEQGRLLGLSQSLSALARVVGPIWGGFSFARIGIGAPYITGAVFVALAVLTMILVPKSLPEAPSIADARGEEA